jgi:TPR repeat protein
MVSDESANRVIAEQTIYDADRTLNTAAFPLHPSGTVLTKDDELMDRAVLGSSKARMSLYKLVRDGNPEFSAYRKFPFRKPYSGFWFLCRAADNGYAEARYELGRLYEIGDDQVPKDLVKALMWYRLSTKGGHDWAIKDIDRLSRSATPNQMEQLEDMLSHWKPRACEEELYESKRKANQEP